MDEWVSIWLKEWINSNLTHFTVFSEMLLPSRVFFSEIAHPVPGLEAYADPAGVPGRERPHHHHHLLLPRLLQRVRDQVHARLRTQVRLLCSAPLWLGRARFFTLGLFFGMISDFFLLRLCHFCMTFQCRFIWWLVSKKWPLYYTQEIPSRHG